VKEVIPGVTVVADGVVAAIAGTAAQEMEGIYALGSSSMRRTLAERVGAAKERTRGYDLEMTKVVAEAVTVPVIASGGAGKLEHFYEAIVTGRAAAVLAASIFHFGEISIPEAKTYLKERGMAVKI
jgi:imidazole glycerol phosphate synthase subunit HisF